MKQTNSILLFLLLSVAALGCDSTEDEGDDRQRIQEEWMVTGVADEERDLTTEFEAFGAIMVNFGSSTYEFIVDPVEGTSVTFLNGSYTLVPLTKSIILQATVQGQTVPIPATYELTEQGLELTLDSQLVGALVNAAVEPDIALSGDLTFELRPHDEVPHEH